MLLILDCLDVDYDCRLIFLSQILGISYIRKAMFIYFEFLNMHKVFLPNIYIYFFFFEGGHLLWLTSSLNVVMLICLISSEYKGGRLVQAESTTLD